MSADLATVLQQGLPSMGINHHFLHAVAYGQLAYQGLDLLNLHMGQLTVHISPSWYMALVLMTQKNNLYWATCKAMWWEVSLYGPLFPSFYIWVPHQDMTNLMLAIMHPAWHHHHHEHCQLLSLASEDYWNDSIGYFGGDLQQWFSPPKLMPHIPSCLLLFGICTVDGMHIHQQPVLVRCCSSIAPYILLVLDNETNTRKVGLLACQLNTSAKPLSTTTTTTTNIASWEVGPPHMLNVRVAPFLSKEPCCTGLIKASGCLPPMVLSLLQPSTLHSGGALDIRMNSLCGWKYYHPYWIQTL